MANTLKEDSLMDAIKALLAKLTTERSGFILSQIIFFLLLVADALTSLTVGSYWSAALTVIVLASIVHSFFKVWLPKFSS